MTEVSFFTQAGTICGFCVTGHSTNSCDDIDGKIVCSAVSSAVYMAANTVTDVIGQKAQITLDEATFLFKVTSPGVKTVAVLNGLKLHLTELSKEYSGRIKVFSEV